MCKIKNSFKISLHCIHSSLKQIWERLCRRIAGEYLWSNQNTDYISHAYYWGTISSTNLPSSCLVVISFLFQNDTSVCSVKHTGKKKKSYQKHTTISVSVSYVKNCTRD